jgi:uncharacterized protein (DUF362 family)
LNQVRVETCADYELPHVLKALEGWRPLFAGVIRPGQTVVLKPNWISHAHKLNPQEWHSVITHPSVITGVLTLVLDCLAGRGKVVITDGPQTDAAWEKIMARMTPELWRGMGAGVEVSILDLRDDEWEVQGDVNVGRKKLPGDPNGSTEVDLGGFSEFASHQASRRGYYGADYDMSETNLVHSHGHHKYRVSRTVIDADVFINLPKLKTHKKAGITCSLKNLVGINTYKNWLPHHSEGTPDEGGDQFPVTNLKNRAETILLEKFKAYLFQHQQMARWLIPVKSLGKRVFGTTQEVVRSGNWYGNQTIWRMILDLNKILLYANGDGSLRADAPANRKTYLSIVDAIVAGEGNGPEAPTPKKLGLLIGGANPVAVDAVCAKVMGFDWQRIPSIANAFRVRDYKLCDFQYPAIDVVSLQPQFLGLLRDLDGSQMFRFQPHFGWTGHVELES